MEKITIKDWLSVATNIAVVAGIVFLGIELRQNNSLLQQEAEQVYFQNRIALSEILMQDGELAEIFVRANRDEELSDVEALRIGRYYTRLFRGFQWEHNQHQNGYINIRRPGRWASLINQNKYSLEVWDWFVANAADEDFISYVDENVLTQ